ncbi:SMI1/KNR4 family protein [Treponema sp. OMZ 799]|uniref:SMI1/KNR4 family protein n=1 Tax=unclassified Treponema TaxID=2638727 RepID=UPI0020A2B4B6|nr:MULTISPECIES: SMI1/KNR4 family protein [unclassified Treponema]UTC67007.1 SMI1/KNR4 family protein [Treponema sp. OMZ 789]UTC69736.1 SMI1/KNR4 family protein [Treponema sp. OMZ 790]UTC72450.1 SMI1/KNR4 family protein [Treponema sp. OMZ 791]UTC76944.1 SMI1/KNR4 family protein [Treponema sp. OMZ 799]
MKQKLIKRLQIFFDRHPSLRGKPADIEQITAAEQELNIKLDEDYKEFIKLFGGAYAGLTIHAFENGESIGKETIIELTRYARKLFNDIKLFPEINTSLVIADDGSGNPIAIEADGSVVLFDLDIEKKRVIACSFERLIEQNFEEW